MSNIYAHYPAVLHVIDLISQGYTTTRACAIADLRVSMFERVIADDEELGDMLVDADRQGTDAMADALTEFDNHAVYGQTDVRKAKLMSDNIKWILAKRHPDKYGEKVTIDHSIRADVVITSELDAARSRVIDHIPGEAIQKMGSAPLLDVTPKLASPDLREEKDSEIAALLS